MSMLVKTLLLPAHPTERMGMLAPEIPCGPHPQTNPISPPAADRSPAQLEDSCSILTVGMFVDDADVVDDGLEVLPMQLVVDVDVEASRYFRRTGNDDRS